jgi:hypothetical protein
MANPLHLLYMKGFCGQETLNRSRISCSCEQFSRLSRDWQIAAKLVVPEALIPAGSRNPRC